MRTIAIINQKGGVGKTTTVTNLGAALAEAGHRVLAIDMDPQTHLTLSLDVEPTANRPSVYEVLSGAKTVTQAAIKTRKNLWLVCSHINLAAAEMELVSVMGREVVLRDALAKMKRKFDFVLIDCPPSLGLLTINALTAAEEVFIPLQPHFLALQGVGKLFETVAMVRDRLNPKLSVAGVLLCLYEAGTRLAAEVEQDLRAFLEQARGTTAPWANARIFDTVIRRNIKLAECPSHGLTIFDYEPRSNGAADYRRLADELLGKTDPAETPAEPPAVEQADAAKTAADQHEPTGETPAAAPPDNPDDSGVIANIA